MMCVLLFTIAALSVDLGNAFARRTDTQTQADYGALAAARMQTETAKSGMTIPTAMVDAVRDAMNANQPQDDASLCWTTKTCVTSAQLIDGNLVNGELRFCSGTTCGAGYASTVKGLQVIAPRNKVQYGFARVLGVQNGSVSASALVNVFTAGKRVMPMYAVQGCDYGLQTLADPANGHTTPVVPTLAYDTDTNTTAAHAAEPGAEELHRQRGRLADPQLDRQHGELRRQEVGQRDEDRLLPRRRSRCLRWCRRSRASGRRATRRRPTSRRSRTTTPTPSS